MASANIHFSPTPPPGTPPMHLVCILCACIIRNKALSYSIKTIEANPKIQSVILLSSNPKIYSAGLDIAELVAPKTGRLVRFWNLLQQVYIDLYGTRLATVVVIQGHAPAAGCLLALMCDYRIMWKGWINMYPLLG